MLSLILKALAVSAIIILPMHDKTRPDLDKWFEGLSSGKGPCCSDADGTALTDTEWRTVKDADKPNVHYQVFIKEKWWDVQDDAVLKQPNLYGPTIVWPVYYSNIDSSQDRVEIRCFIPGSMT